MNGSQFPSLTALHDELPPTITRPRRWGWHTAAELAFIVVLVGGWLIFGGGS